MKLATFTFKGKTRVGAVVGDWIVDSLGVKTIPEDMIGFLEGGASSIDAMQQLVAKNTQRIALADVILQAPVPRPRKFLGVGLNYADHIDETELEKPEYPTFFTKQSSCVIGQGAAIHRPKVSEKLDYEGELAFVIGKRCRHVAVDKAHEVIAGYTIANDVSVRDWQFRSATWTLGKSFDTHGPLGPWLVTSDEIGDPHQLALETWLDDEKRQSSNTRHMIFNCFEMIAYLTQAMTLEPGDVITTGTPAGVGVKMKPRGYMKPGQTVRVSIEKIGTLINPVIAEPDSIFPIE
ncbi:fumarylacetoacetate hydrolase family protein [Methylicorpusculum sp.]|uniref:fumarylacetoacetate hydrolase family protein n=1 Tax=Methylicorpusculum sp. TaxID=2713644 RepID=UPI002730F7C5|nr:fumarylacetoacetate hydrolase family protein [Methylicorpusculum sp.]MDP2180400.1 fumarylacetoacetate hydrolase family protein [Methylicorpusculum sp.]MDP3530799.1 fumarylacetoacetate hydrolase family protein [Methylicorpusculum sp.]MDZ4151523.1 fumarylacetoacetate hydrolase family protein [Methylicorpusculum sp.]